MSTGSTDKFTCQVYEASVHACIEAEVFRHQHQQPSNHIVMGELFKSLSYLIKTLYVAASSHEPLVIDTRAQMTRYYLLHLTCCMLPPLPSDTPFTQRLVCCPHSSSIFAVLTTLDTSMSSHPLIKTFKHLFSALRHDLDYLRVSRFIQDATVQDKVFLKFLVPHLRLRIGQIMKRAFLTYPVQKVIDRFLFENEAELVEWMSCVDAGLFVLDGMVCFRSRKR